MFKARTNLPKVKNGAYLINLDDYKPIRTHWITFYVNDDNVKFFDSIEVEHIQKYI